MDDVITIVIADDHAIFRDGLKLMIKKEKGLKVVGEAANGKELIEKVDELTPHVVLTDIVMPEMDGIAAARIISTKHSNVGIIALSSFDQEYLVIDMIEAGALGYLLKNTGRKEIVDAIEAVYLKQCYYCETVSAQIKKRIAGSSFNPFSKFKKIMFNETEIEIIRLLCEELTSKEIASLMFLSPRTIDGHRQRIMERIGAKSIAGILMYAVKNGIYKI
jgi:DNA-binding NarL/FixJ family response regulator